MAPKTILFTKRAPSARNESPSARSARAKSSSQRGKKGTTGSKKNASKKLTAICAIAEETADAEPAIAAPTPAAAAKPTEVVDLTEVPAAPTPAAAAKPTEVVDLTEVPAAPAPAPVADAPKPGAIKPKSQKKLFDKATLEHEAWVAKAAGLFDKIDVDKSGAIDKRELMAKLRSDGELEELLGAKKWGIAEAAEGTEEEEEELSFEEAKQRRRRAREERRAKLLHVLFDEFDVVVDEGTAKSSLKFVFCEAQPSGGREVVSEDLTAALSASKSKTRLVDRAEAAKFSLQTPQGKALAGEALQHGDYAQHGSGWFQLHEKDDQLNRDEFRELVRLGRMRMIFNSMDVDGSGHVDKRELAAKLQADNELEEVLGFRAVSGPAVYTSHIYVNLAFQFDMNHDGQLNRGEFEKMLTSATIKAREEAAKQSAMADAATS